MEYDYQKTVDLIRRYANTRNEARRFAIQIQEARQFLESRPVITCAEDARAYFQDVEIAKKASDFLTDKLQKIYSVADGLAAEIYEVSGGLPHIVDGVIYCAYWSRNSVHIRENKVESGGDDD